MSENTHDRILRAVLLCLRPMVKIMLQCGIGYRAFAELAKTAFVDVATSEYGVRGRPTNMSRVAVMTGLTRKEVRRLRDQSARGEERYNGISTPMGHVLHKWISDDEFTNESGGPADLPFEGEKGSFKRLIKKYGGDIPPGAIRTELKRVGCVEESEDGVLRLAKRAFRPSEGESRVVNILLRSAYPVLQNVAHNLDPATGEDTWPQHTVYTKAIRASDLPRIRRITSDRCIDFVESFDDMFIAYEALHEQEGLDADDNPVAITIAYFEEHSREASDLW